MYHVCWVQIIKINLEKTNNCNFTPLNTSNMEELSPAVPQTDVRAYFISKHLQLLTTAGQNRMARFISNVLIDFPDR